MTKINSVIFDLNGVFLESEPLSKRIEDKFNVDKDLFWTELKNILKIARTPDKRPENLWDPITNLLKISQNDFFNFWFSGENINSDLLNFAKELKKDGCKIFILSNNLKERTEYYRQNFPELFNSFDGVYFSWETGFVKPDQKAFENILRINNLDPDKCVYFDDSLDNIEVAKNLGIHATIFENLQKTIDFIEGV